MKMKPKEGSKKEEAMDRHEASDKLLNKMQKRKAVTFKKNAKLAASRAKY